MPEPVDIVGTTNEEHATYPVDRGHVALIWAAV